MHGTSARVSTVIIPAAALVTISASAPKARVRDERKAANDRARAKRAYRRQTHGKAVYRIEIGAPVIDMLLALEWLTTEAEADNPVAVGKAISAMLTDTAKDFLTRES
jgi:hypothetical protein